MLQPTATSYRHRMAVFTLALLLHSTVSADLIFSAPPRESAEDAAKLYDPFAKELSELLGETVVYQYPGSWQNYQKRLQNDEYDIVFDGPHFAAWRMDALQATPLVRLPGSLQFVLVVRANDAGISEPKHLVGKPVCTLPSPNLGALALYSMFPNPVVQPDFQKISGGFRQVTDKLLAGECRGAIMNSSFYYNKLPVEERSQTKVLKESQPIINQGITVSRRVTPQAQSRMLQSLTTTSSSHTAIKPILDRFAHKVDKFIPAQNEEYADLNLLHDNMLFGW